MHRRNRVGLLACMSVHVSSPPPGLHLLRPPAIPASSRDGGILNVRAFLPLGVSKEGVGIVGWRFLLGEEGSADM